MSGRPRFIAHLHLHADLTDTGWQDVLDVLVGITPLVQVIPPTAVQIDLTGARRYFDRSPYDLVQIVQLRLAALLGITASAGLAGTRMLAAMACAETLPGRTTTISPGQSAVDAWLRPRPVTALPGVGTATAANLRRLGIRTVGQVADLPPATLQRALASAPAARQLAARARGTDPRAVIPDEPAARITADQTCDRDQLDPADHHRAVLALAEETGVRLRGEHAAAAQLTLTIRYADHSTSTRTRRLPEATAHSPALAATALAMLASLTLERARVRAYTLRADQLRPAEQAHRQLHIDPGSERAHAAEAAADRARRRFGSTAVRPATLANPTRPRPRARRDPDSPMGSPGLLASPDPDSGSNGPEVHPLS